ncbi:hypothetical protein T4E_5094 [Trichinella pseudospiralis]|uniref:Uncharacterized protein n=1 Tax=Trichinella pseudospiralis TaxID=6337 RepID=A0A0V0XTY7_TRIPS|nr:hypothetical protein T4E_5094 [Trichinella pseudospiralis]
MGWQEGMVVLLITHKYDRSIKTQKRRARKQKSKLSFSEACTRVLAYEKSPLPPPSHTDTYTQLAIYKLLKLLKLSLFVFN